jgi:hypothetical protein
MYNGNSSSLLILTNVTISGNTASRGGGMYNYPHSIKIRNSIIWGNNSGIYLVAPEIIYSDIQELTVYGTNISADPLFVNLQQATSGNPTTAGDYRLQEGSPAINAGSNDLYPNTWEKWAAMFTSPSDNPISQTVYTQYVLPYLANDLAGDTRIQSTTIDMGAYESP